ncbi:MAG: T9SS type A sorting domain-containing protein [Rhodothermales bacterium]
MREMIRLLFLVLFFAVSTTAAYSQKREVAAGTAGFEDVADSFHITAAYPNPFNPQTQFTLTVAQTQHVTVEIYNLLGRRVALLYDTSLSAQKTHTFTFDAKDLPSGLYLIRTVGEHFSNTQRVTLLR